MSLQRCVLSSHRATKRFFLNSKRSFSGALIPQHINTNENSVDTSFDFTDENYVEVDKILARYPANYKQSASIPLLWLAQKQCGNWVPLAAMNKIAEICEVNPMRIYEVTTFYTMFNRQKIGTHHLQLCTTTPCQLSGAEDVRDKIREYLKIPEKGDTSPDGMFTITEVECLGACVNAPMMQVNGEHFYEDLNEENVVELLDGLKAGKAKPGPQTDRYKCVGPLEQSTLKTLPPVAKCRDFDKIRAEMEQAQLQK
eukprot:40995_1